MDKEEPVELVQPQEVHWNDLSEEQKEHILFPGRVPAYLKGNDEKSNLD